MYIHRSCKNKCMLFLENSKIMFREAVKSKKLFFFCFFDFTTFLKIILQFPKNNMHLFLQDLWIYMYLFILLLKLLILHLGKRSFEPFKIIFLEKALYFINVLTKRNNLSHSEAIFICQFPQNMKVGVAGHTFFEKSNEVNFLNSSDIVSFHAKFQVIRSTFLFHSLSP